jgi:hypothetical protein
MRKEILWEGLRKGSRFIGKIGLEWDDNIGKGLRKMRSEGEG